jgi:hypothetical protein
MRGLAKDTRDLRLVRRVRHRPWPVDRDVARRLRPELNRLRVEGRLRACDGRQLLIFDRDQLRRVDRGLRCLRHDQRHGVPDMAHAIPGERRPMRDNEAPAVAARHRRRPRDAADACRVHVVGGKHIDHAGRLPRRCAIEPHDPGMCVRRADEDAGELAW